jgi:hypothetical protein
MYSCFICCQFSFLAVRIEAGLPFQQDCFCVLFQVSKWCFGDLIMGAEKAATDRLSFFCGSSRAAIAIRWDYLDCFLVWNYG